MKTRTRAQLLAQLEDEQAAGDPQWGQPADNPAFDALLRLLVTEVAPHLDDDTPEIVHIHRHSRPAA